MRGLIKIFFSSFTVLFVLSVIVLYVFIFFIMLHPVEAIDAFLEVRVSRSRVCQLPQGTDGLPLGQA